MADAPSKVAAKHEETEASQSTALRSWQPFDALRREMDRLFDDFGRGFLPATFRRSSLGFEPFGRQDFAWASKPAVDVVEKEKTYEIIAELPGLDEGDIEVKLANGGITIKGAKKEEKEEKNKNYHLHERRFGSFERYFSVPEGVDVDKIEAKFNKGVLTLTLPKKPEAQKPEKKIEIKSA
jgi:HSP20 family protein